MPSGALFCAWVGSLGGDLCLGFSSLLRRWGDRCRSRWPRLSRDRSRAWWWSSVFRWKTNPPTHRNMYFLAWSWEQYRTTSDSSFSRVQVWRGSLWLSSHSKKSPFGLSRRTHS